jgi:hypothetical protein
MAALGSRSRLLLVLGAVGVLVVGLIVGLVVAGDDDGGKVRTAADDGSSTTSTGDSTTSSTVAGADGPSDAGEGGGGATIAPPATVPTDGLTGDALELANAINKASLLTYRARYEGDHTNPTNGKVTHTTIEIWRQLPLARRDTLVASPDGTLHTEELRLSDRLVGCVDRNKGDTAPEWICVPKGDKGVDPAEPLLGIARPSGGAVVARSATVAGVAARCFQVSAATVSDVCFDGDGIPVSLDGGDSNMVRTDLSRGVDPNDIAIPEGAEMRDSNEVSQPS